MKTIAFWLLLLGLGLVSAPVDAFEVGFVQDGQLRTMTARQVGPGHYQFNSHGRQVIHLATLDWAPYIGEGICGQGWVQQFVVGAFLQLDYEVNVRFYPWKRALKTVEDGSADALFPEYFIDDAMISEIHPDRRRRDLLALSDPFPGGDLALWKRRTDPFDFNGDLSTLAGMTIGAVAGYVNTVEFDAMAAQGVFKLDTSADDWTNLRKLERGRVPLIVGDPDVLNFTVRSQLPPRDAQTFLNQIEMIEPVLEEKPLYLAFSRRREGYQNHLNAFNTAVQTRLANGELAQVRTKYLAAAHLDQACERVAQR